MIPAQAVEAAIRTMPEYTPEDEADSFDRETNDMCRAKVERILAAAAPHMLADILEDAANTAETDELTTAAEVIYDLRRHARDLRPANAV